MAQANSQSMKVMQSMIKNNGAQVSGLFDHVTNESAGLKSHDVNPISRR
jgi:hypothetical protein